MDSNSKKNYLFNLMYQILNMIIPFITAPYIARVLGAEMIGISSYTASIVSYFVMFATLGITAYGQREIAFFQDNEKQRSIIFYEILIEKIITVSVALVLYFVFLKIYKNYKIYFYIQTLLILTVFFDITWFFQGLEKFKNYSYSKYNY